MSDLTKRDKEETTLLRQLTFEQADPTNAGGVTIKDEFSHLQDEDKNILVGTHFRILDLSFKDNGDFGPHVTVWIITRENLKFVFTDGSTGIFRQLRTMREARAPLPYDVPKGLRRSDYQYTDADGRKRPAHTYYLAG